MILAAGLSPAWQQILRFGRFVPGEVNRAEDAHWCASGKVLNVAVALEQLEARCRVVAPLGGITGRAIQEEFTTRGGRLDCRWQEVPVATRVCTTILSTEDGVTTELVEECAALSAQQQDDFVEQFQQAAREADVMVLSGSLPPGTEPDLFARMLEGVASQAVLDIRGEPLNRALPRRPLLVKPNRAELAATFGEPLDDPSALRRAIGQLHERGAQWVAITDGPRPLWLSGPGGPWRLHPPPISLVNPIGSGDSLTAAVAWAVDEGHDMFTAIRLGIGVACNNAEQLLPGRVEAARVRHLAEQVQVEVV